MAPVQGKSASQMGSAISVLNHFGAFITYSVTLLCMHSMTGGDGLDKFRSFGGLSKFLTIWNLYLQTVYFGLALSQDLFGSVNGKLRKIVDFIHASLAWPVGAFVTVSFWSIYAIDRELVYPRALDQFIPTWVNHAMHTVVLPCLLIDKWVVHHQYPRKRTAMSVLLTFICAYQAWILYIAYAANIWVYPLLQHMNWPYRIFFFALCWNFMFLLFYSGRLLTQQIWGVKSVQAKKKKSK